MIVLTSLIRSVLLRGGQSADISPSPSYFSIITTTVAAVGGALPTNAAPSRQDPRPMHSPNHDGSGGGNGHSANAAQVACATNYNLNDDHDRECAADADLRPTKHGDGGRTNSRSNLFLDGRIYKI